LYYVQREFEKADDYYERAKSLIINYKSSQNAELLNNYGLLKYRLGKYQDALDLLERSLEIKMRILKSNDAKLARTYNNLGFLYNRVELFDLALECFDKAKDIMISNFGVDNPETAKVYANIAAIYWSVRDFGKSIECNKYAIEYARLIDDSTTMSIIYNKMGLYNISVQDYLQSISYFNLGLACNITNNIKHKHNSYDGLARCYIKLGYPDSASYYFNKIYEGLGDKDENHYISSTDLTYAIFCINNDIQVDVLKILDETLSGIISIYGKNHSLTASAFSNIGYYYDHIGAYDSALKYFQSSIDALIPINSIEDQLQQNRSILNNYFSGEILIYGLMARAMTLVKIFDSDGDTSKLISGIDSYLLALKVSDRSRIGFQSRISKFEIAKNYKKICCYTIKATEKAYEVTGDEKYRVIALEIAERSKVGILHDLIRESEAKKYANIPDSLLGNEEKLRKDITLLQNLIYSESSNPIEERDSIKIAILNRELFHSKEDYYKLLNYLNLTFPKYYEYRYKQEVCSVKDIQDLVNNNKILIEYFLEDTVIYTFCITNDTLVFRELIIDSSFFELFRYLPDKHSIHTIFFDSTRVFNNYIKSAYTLYTMLIKPVGRYIDGKSIIIIPDSDLGYISFESLISDTSNLPSRVDYSKLDYLINKWSISYSYSATLLLKSMKVKTKSAVSREVLAFAPIYFNNL